MAKGLTRAQQKRARLPAVPVVDPVFDITPEQGQKSGPAMVNGVAGKTLLAFIKRIENVEDEMRSLREDRTEIKKEAKGFGFDVKVITHLIRRRRMDKSDLEEFESLVETYERAIGNE
jgi:uncharacterized protein (UPF0335 family)